MYRGISSINIPNNKFTYQKMIDFTLGLGDYWVRFIEQFVPATTIWNTGQKMDNSIFHRQKVVWRRQRSCEYIALSCNPCEYDGQPYAYDCIDQTTTCTLPTFNPSTVLNQNVQQIYASSGFTSNDCDNTTIIADWYVVLKLVDIPTSSETTLVNQLILTSYGQNAIDTSTNLPVTYYDILNYIDNSLQYLYQNGLNYYLSGGNLIVSNSACYDNFTNKQLNLSIGLDIQINCG
jgi:hypothetical protein